VSDRSFGIDATALPQCHQAAFRPSRRFSVKRAEVRQWFDRSPIMSSRDFNPTQTKKLAKRFNFNDLQAVHQNGAVIRSGEYQL